MLTISGLNQYYGGSHILRDLSFEIPAGACTTILGRNGVGKTTFMDTLAGATRQHGGSIELGGAALHRLPAHARAGAGIGWVPQERNIFKSLTVLENLTAVARPGVWTPQRVFELFPRLAQRQNNMGNQLSGGEQQMLAVGRALVLNPKLLLLDEPLEGLAPIIVEELLQAIRRITREEGMSAIIVEQHPQAILAISHQAVVLDQGRVIHSGSAAALVQQAHLLDQLLGVSKIGRAHV